MINLPDNIELLRPLLHKYRENYSIAKKRFEYSINKDKSDLYDKFVAAPVEEAKSLGLSKEEIAIKKEKGMAQYESELEKQKKKIDKECKLSAYSSYITKIKQKMLEIDPNSLNEETKAKTITTQYANAQTKFEMNY